MEGGPIFNHELLSDEDLANDQRQKAPSSLYFAETDRLQEFDYPILASTLEPLLRKVVREEIDHKLQQYLSPEILALTKPSSLPQIQAQEQPRYKLVFPKNLKLPIFTANKLLDIENNPPEIHLVDINSNIGEQMTPISLNPPPKVELVVLNGDFPPKGCESWTSNQFEANIVKERNDKPPLLLGELIVTLNGGSATIEDIEFSDNSSWIRSRKFKIGARVVPGTNLHGSVLEAMTEGFVVKEYRVGCRPGAQGLLWFGGEKWEFLGGPVGRSRRGSVFRWGWVLSVGVLLLGAGGCVQWRWRRGFAAFKAAFAVRVAVSGWVVVIATLSCFVFC